MTSTTIPGRVAILAITPFRRFADWSGEGGALLMMGVPLFTSYMLLSTAPGRIALNLACMGVMAVVSLAIFARHQDNAGHAAMAKLRKTNAKGPRRDYAEGLAFLKLPETATVEDIKAAVRVLMKRHHSDTGTGAYDMDQLVTFRNRMVDHAGVDAGRVKAPGAEALLNAYQASAGRLGTAWGRMFPSKRLKDLGFE